MRAADAFEHRKDALLAQLEQAQGMDAALSACVMALEQTACELAQDEQDEHARQRQQAVMSIARRAPQLLRASAARGELVLEDAAQRKEDKREKLRRGAGMAGALLLAALALYELLDGQTLFALLQLAGGGLLAYGSRREKDAQQAVHARGVAVIDAGQAVRALGELCQAADICVSDLALLEKDAGTARLSGTADEAMLDLLSALMEAKATGRNEAAMRSLSQAEQYLRMLGVEIIAYSEESAQLFDILPTMGEARTIRPALMREGKLLRRGAAAVGMERSVAR